MNRNKFALLVTAGLCITSVIEYLKVHAEETKKREEIKAKLAKDLYSVEVGTARVIARIDNGEYMPRSLDELYNTVQFEQLAVYNENE